TMNTLTKRPHRGWNLSGDFDQLFDGLLSRFETPDTHIVPPLDIVETKDSYLVKADLPGINRDDLSVSVKEGMLTIEAQTNTENVEKEGETFIRVERRSGKYQRRLRLGKLIDDSAITADYKDGVLTVAIPRREQEEGRRISINVE
ncbi:MAG: Hsp20/alpha crystallin family protein, partial [Gammaproteobacteria bacterium]|nr:Hsp20/alpha crystallin family protein [Gammaproteobacteria bacterium]